MVPGDGMMPPYLTPCGEEDQQGRPSETRGPPPMIDPYVESTPATPLPSQPTVMESPRQPEGKTDSLRIDSTHPPSTKTKSSRKVINPPKSPSTPSSARRRLRTGNHSSKSHSSPSRSPKKAASSKSIRDQKQKMIRSKRKARDNEACVLDEKRKNDKNDLDDSIPELPFLDKSINEHFNSSTRTEQTESTFFEDSFKEMNMQFAPEIQEIERQISFYDKAEGGHGMSPGEEILLKTMSLLLKVQGSSPTKEEGTGKAEPSLTNSPAHSTRGLDGSIRKVYTSGLTHRKSAKPKSTKKTFGEDLGTEDGDGRALASAESASTSGADDTPLLSGKSGPSQFLGGNQHAGAGNVNADDLERLLNRALGQAEALIIKQKFMGLEVLAENAASSMDAGVMSSFTASYCGGQAQPKTFDIYATNDSSSSSRKISSSSMQSRGPTFQAIDESYPCAFGGTTVSVYMPEHSMEEEVMTLEQPCCQDMTVYRGKPGKDDVSGPKNPSAVLGLIKEPRILGGCDVSPQIQIMDRDGNDGEQIATVKANSSCGCFGGLFCDESFRVENPDGGPYLGHIVKEKPPNMRQFAKELIGKSDVYTLYMKKDLDVEKKANLLASVLYLDYKFFEHDKAAKCDLGSCQCRFTLCILTCCGSNYPIKYPIRRVTTNDDEEGDGEEEEEEPEAEGVQDDDGEYEEIEDEVLEEEEF